MTSSPSPAGLSATILCDWPAVQAIGREWDDLLHRSAADTIYLSWDWIRTWADVGGSAARPFVVVVRDEAGRLLGLAPFYLSRLDLLRAAPFRILRIMADRATGSEYPDWIVDALRADEAARAIAAALARSRQRWDCIWMPSVAGWTGARDRIAAAAAAAGLRLRERHREFGVMTLPSSGESYWQTLSAQARRAVRVPRRRLSAAGPLEYVTCRAEDGRLGPLLEALFELHHRRWMTKGDPGAFRRKPLEERFYRRFAPLAGRNGWLRIAALVQNGVVRAIQYGYDYNGTHHNVQEGFDPGAAGIGNVIRVALIESCIQDRLSHFDFLGDMTANKKRWGARARAGCDLLIGSRSLRSSLLFASRTWPTGQFSRLAQIQ